MKLNDNIDGKLIKKLRQKLMLSQVEFAEWLEVSPSTENRWENDHHLPSFKTQRKIRMMLERILEEESELNRRINRT